LSSIIIHVCVRVHERIASCWPHLRPFIRILDDACPCGIRSRAGIPLRVAIACRCACSFHLRQRKKAERRRTKESTQARPELPYRPVIMYADCKRCIQGSISTSVKRYSSNNERLFLPPNYSSSTAISNGAVVRRSRATVQFTHFNSVYLSISAY